MTAVTQAKIEAALDRALDELGIDDYKRFMASMEDVVLYALCKQSGLTRILPQMSTLEMFGEARKRIATRADVAQLLQELNEPSPEELGQTLSFLKELASTFKRGLKELDSQIRP